jgi:hypothetical protein
LKNPITIKGWWSGSRGKTACLASERPCVQTPVLPKKKKERKEQIQGTICKKIQSQAGQRPLKANDCSLMTKVQIQQFKLSLGKPRLLADKAQSFTQNQS